MVSINEILEKAASAGIAETVKYLADLAECQNPNLNSLRGVVTRLQSDEKHLRRTGAKGKENLMKFLEKPFPFPKINAERSILKNVTLLNIYVIDYNLYGLRDPLF